jgi:glycyl-tRNA synthetase beta chain
MREHQKYFAVEDAAGALMPHFIAVNNTAARDPALVARGHQRVLRARLEDAMFFYRSDLKASMEDWVAKLQGVLFQAKLGSMHAKALRVQALAETVAGWVDAAGTLRAEASRAALLCKADLVSQMVVEFPKLQGVMGRVYAAVAGEPEAVAVAIQEHYRPTASGGALPRTQTGAVVSIADKMDSICGCFRVGLVPTGGSDPYALRRQGIGIVQIMRDQGMRFSLGKLIAAALAAYEGIGDAPPAQSAEQVFAFLRNRMAHLLTEEGLSKDVVAAVVAASADDVPDVWERARALEALRAAPDFEPLAIAFKRVVNIMKKAGVAPAPADAGAVSPARFEHPCEGDLILAYQRVKAEVARHQADRRPDLALRAIAALRGAVDDFFDGAMVMAEDPAVRDNRFALLALVAGLFENIADFSKIST